MFSLVNYVYVDCTEIRISFDSCLKEIFFRIEEYSFILMLSGKLQLTIITLFQIISNISLVSKVFSSCKIDPECDY